MPHWDTSWCVALIWAVTSLLQCTEIIQTWNWMYCQFRISLIVQVWKDSWQLIVKEHRGYIIALQAMLVRARIITSFYASIYHFSLSFQPFESTHWYWGINGLTCNLPTINRTLCWNACSVYKFRFSSPFDHRTPNSIKRAAGEILRAGFSNTPTVSFILKASCKTSRCGRESVHLGTSRFRFKWNACGCSRTSDFRCDVCSKCSPPLPLSANTRVFSASGHFQHLPLMDSSYSHFFFF